MNTRLTSSFSKKECSNESGCIKSFESHFGDFKDPSIERTKLYTLSEILFVVLTGSVCGAESWRDFVLFGEERLEFLQEYYCFEQKNIEFFLGQNF